MKPFKLLFALPLIFIFSSCATPYQESGLMGGYETEWLSPDTIKVAVNGNGFTSDSRVKNFTLIQVSEKAKVYGYKYFIFLQNENNGAVERHYSPPTYYTSTSGTITGNHYSGSSTTTGYGGVSEIYKPARTVIAKLFKDVPNGYMQGQYYDVENILITIKPLYVKDKASKNNSSNDISRPLPINSIEQPKIINNNAPNSETSTYQYVVSPELYGLKNNNPNTLPQTDTNGIRVIKPVPYSEAPHTTIK